MNHVWNLMDFITITQLEWFLLPILFARPNIYSKLSYKSFEGILPVVAYDLPIYFVLKIDKCICQVVHTMHRISANVLTMFMSESYVSTLLLCFTSHTQRLYDDTRNVRG